VRYNRPGDPLAPPLMSNKFLYNSIEWDVNLASNTGKVFVIPINNDVARSAWFLHEGGYTAMDSAIPGKFVPPRPFMKAPFLYLLQTLREVMGDTWHDIFDSLNLKRKV